MAVSERAARTWSTIGVNLGVSAATAAIVLALVASRGDSNKAVQPPTTSTSANCPVPPSPSPPSSAPGGAGPQQDIARPHLGLP